MGNVIGGLTAYAIIGGKIVTNDFSATFAFGIKLFILFHLLEVNNMCQHTTVIYHYYNKLIFLNLKPMRSSNSMVYK